jgi:hypothetical protein
VVAAICDQAQALLAWQAAAVVRPAHEFAVTQTPLGHFAPAGQASTAVQTQVLAAAVPLSRMAVGLPWHAAAVV